MKIITRHKNYTSIELYKQKNGNSFCLFIEWHCWTPLKYGTHSLFPVIGFTVYSGYYQFSFGWLKYVIDFTFNYHNKVKWDKIKKEREKNETIQSI